MPQIAHFKSKYEKAPDRGRGTPPSHTLPPLGRYAPSGLVASLPRKDCAPQMFWLITPLVASKTILTAICLQRGLYGSFMELLHIS